MGVPEYRWSTAAELQPHTSTAWEGYLWLIEATDELHFVTDLDEIAKHEEVKGREVSIIAFDTETLNSGDYTSRWLEKEGE